MHCNREVIHVKWVENRTNIVHIGNHLYFENQRKQGKETQQ